MMLNSLASSVPLKHLGSIDNIARTAFFASEGA